MCPKETNRAFDLERTKKQATLFGDILKDLPPAGPPEAKINGVLPTCGYYTRTWGRSQAYDSARIRARVVSSMRLANPHSLSNQARTLTVWPETRVWVPSTTLERGSWL